MLLRTGQLLLIISQLALVIFFFRQKRKAATLIPAVLHYLTGFLLFAFLLNLTADVFSDGRPRTDWPWILAIRSLPWLVILCAELISAYLLFFGFRDLLRYRKRQLLPEAVKETVDLLPVGFCFGDPSGEVQLSNLRMNQIPADINPAPQERISMNKVRKRASTPQNPAKLANVQNTILNVTDDTKDVKGSTYTLLKAKGVPLSKSSIKLTWSKVPGATKYIIYGNKCGKKSKYVKITSVKKSKTSYTRKKLAKGTYYKFMVVAVKGSDVLATSKTIHVATNGGKGKKGNPSAITLNKKSISVKVGKTYKKLKATVKAGTLKVSTHRKVAWESTDVSKAKVNSKGYITGVSKGTCYVYAYAQNGLAVKVKVKVK